jgi:predicted ATPase/DNA-binding SARP family transcriptional activator
MSGIWSVRLLGGLRAEKEERSITKFRPQKAGTLLAYLALNPSVLPTREVLADLLWPEAAPEAGRANLRTALFALRKELEPDNEAVGSVLVTNGHSTVRLNPQSFTTDVGQFRAALRSAARTDITAEKRVEHLEEAVSLYTGPLLPGVYETWALNERERLADEFQRALRDIAAHYEAAGEPRRALDFARRAVEADPLSEEAYGDVIRLLGRLDDRVAALRQYQELARHLEEALGIEPSPRMRALLEEVQQGRLNNPPEEKVPLPLPAPPASPSVVARALNLPPTFTPFFGRTEEMKSVGNMLRSEEARLLTITGAGGSGKTRLALEVARQREADFPGGIWFLTLAEQREPERFAIALANTLGLPRSANSEPIEQVCAALQEKGRTLLVLDNFEQLVDTGGAELVQRLLACAPNLSCLITSRQKLLIEAEQEFPLAPLPTPERAETLPERVQEWPSVQLFLSRAQAARPGFGLTAQNAPAVAELCTRLEGIPLALELAAAWSQTLTPGQMLQRLERRFDLLVTRRRDTTERHATLHGAVEWSYQLLPADLQHFFVRLSLFRGGWTLAAAEQVLDEPNALMFITELRERSLVFASESLDEHEASGDEAVLRFRMLETLREFASEQTIEDEDALCQRHASFFLELAESAEPHLRGPERDTWFRRLDADQENLRAALSWCWEKGAPEPVETGLRLASALWAYWWGHCLLAEGRAHLARGFQTEHVVSPRVRAKAMHSAGCLVRLQGHINEALPMFEEALVLRRAHGTPAEVAEALHYLGVIHADKGELDAAYRQFEECLELQRALGDKRAIAAALGGLSFVAEAREDYLAARTLVEECLALRRQIGDWQGVAYSLLGLGRAYDNEEGWETSAIHFRESLALFRRLQHGIGVAAALCALSYVRYKSGDIREAHGLLVECLLEVKKLEDRLFLPGTLQTAARLADFYKMPVQSVHLWSASITLREATGAAITPGGEAEQNALIAPLRPLLGEAVFQRAWDEGSTFNSEQAIDYALELLSRQEPP